MKIKIFGDGNFSKEGLEHEVNEFLKTVYSPKIHIVSSDNRHSYEIIISYLEEPGYRESAR